LAAVVKGADPRDFPLKAQEEASRSCAHPEGDERTRKPVENLLE